MNEQLNLSPLPWMSQAVCTQVDRDLFFPTSNGGRYQQQVADAKTVCAGCPVIEPCLQRALDLHPVHGIWGGTTEAERRQLHARRNRRTCA